MRLGVTPEDMVEWSSGRFVNGVTSSARHLEGTRSGVCANATIGSFRAAPVADTNKLFNDYIRGWASCSGRGDEAVDTPLIHPLHSAWITSTGQTPTILRD